ncbi:MAG TPA: malto-oligosyltrehalose synthase, partial [Gammaproteobacteria bacterium]|nr:malto-oligosyltrehalose synthase [Gammaproteobacteria bacterium]
MIPPTATYRLQFRNGMTLHRAAELAPYLKGLGISHLYASPLFAAAPGSQHGYDGIDFSVIDPAIGGDKGLESLAEALDEIGMGLILDFVPNHMAASEENPWWRSVLEWGRESPHARVFDIDWSAPKLLLPILGSTFDEALAQGTIRLEFRPTSGSFVFTYYDRCLPLAPSSYSALLARCSDPELAALAPAFETVTTDDASDLKIRLARLAETPAPQAAIDDMLEVAGGAPDFVRAMHDRQIWRLVHWRRARDELTYRRFFEIADLICLRVEDPEVFRDVHERLFEWIGAGRITGIRIDHIDGLADPKAYLENVQVAAPTGGPLYLLVEKILAGDERLRPDWPVAGTTGYEFISAMSELFVDARKELEMTQAYVAFTGESSDYVARARAAKREIFAHNLAAELSLLVGKAKALAGEEFGALDAKVLRHAIIEIAAQLPVYRTYVDAEGPSGDDRALITGAHRGATESANAREREACDFVRDLLLLDAGKPSLREEVLAFTTRFQQTTGPVMAKAIEDTLFYRFNRLIGLNEVGGEPSRYGATISDFHGAMAERRRAPQA